METACSITAPKGRRCLTTTTTLSSIFFDILQTFQSFTAVYAFAAFSGIQNGLYHLPGMKARSPDSLVQLSLRPLLASRYQQSRALGPGVRADIFRVVSGFVDGDPAFADAFSGILNGLLHLPAKKARSPDSFVRLLLRPLLASRYQQSRALGPGARADIFRFVSGFVNGDLVKGDRLQHYSSEVDALPAAIGHLR